jgi:hypothetical protein
LGAAGSAVLDYFDVLTAALVGISVGGYWALRAAAFEYQGDLDSPTDALRYGLGAFVLLVLVVAFLAGGRGIEAIERERPRAAADSRARATRKR